MRITRQETKLLSALSQHGDVSMPELAKHSGIKIHAVRYALSQLKERKIIWPYSFINLRALGYQARTFALALSCEDESSRRHFIRTLTSRPEVSWIAEFSGDYQLAFTLHTISEREVVDFLAALFANKGVGITEKVIQTELSLTYFPLKFFLEHGKRSAVIESSYLGEDVKVDITDRKILASLANTNSRSHSEMARDLKMPVSTFHERVISLQKKKVLVSFTYFLNIDRVGLHTFKALLYVTNAPPEFASQLKEFCHYHPNVSLLVQCSGVWDYEINFELDNVLSVNEFVQLVQKRFGKHLSRIKIIQLLRHLKVSNFPFS